MSRLPRRVSAATALAVTALALLPGVVPEARAHDFCLLPGAPTAAPGTPFDLAMQVADVFPGETVPWRAGRIVSMTLTDARGRLEQLMRLASLEEARLGDREAARATTALAIRDALAESELAASEA